MLNKLATSTGSTHESLEALRNCSVTHASLLVLAGVILLSVLSQVAIYLPFTPVPITGGTFAVFTIGLLYGKRLSFITLLSYIIIGSCGFPVFAGGHAGMTIFSATGGYLIGYLFAAVFCGYSLERGWLNRGSSRIAVLLVGEIVIYLCGLFQLHFFVKKQLLMVGLFPFLIGDMLKLTALLSSYALLKKVRKYISI